MLGNEGTGGDEDFKETMSRVGEELDEAPEAHGVYAGGAFERIFRRALILIGIGVLLVIGMFAMIPFVTSTGWVPGILIVWLVAFMAVAIASVVNWRCPVCGGYLGKGFWGMFSVTHCMHCGARLK